jgi:hypothetical protein
VTRRQGGAVSLAIIASLVVASCSGTGMSGRPSAMAGSAVPPDVATGAPGGTGRPGDAGPPGNTSTPGDTGPPGEASKSIAVPPTGALNAEPPAAMIGVDGGDTVVGELGSFTWQGHGSDAPWLDGRRIHIGPGETLTLTLAESVAVDAWTASRVDAATLDDTTAVGLGEGTAGDPVVFTGPPSGTWSVRVSVWFAGTLGSATYYWRVEVD